MISPIKDLLSNTNEDILKESLKYLSKVNKESINNQDLALFLPKGKLIHLNIK
jgi:hypothetical protein